MLNKKQKIFQAIKTSIKPYKIAQEIHLNSNGSSVVPPSAPVISNKNVLQLFLLN